MYLVRRSTSAADSAARLSAGVVRLPRGVAHIPQAIPSCCVFTNVQTRQAHPARPLAAAASGEIHDAAAGSHERRAGPAACRR